MPQALRAQVPPAVIGQRDPNAMDVAEESTLLRGFGAPGAAQMPAPSGVDQFVASVRCSRVTESDAAHHATRPCRCFLSRTDTQVVEDKTMGKIEVGRKQA